MVRVALDDLLKERGRSLYWLAKESGIPYNTLWRLSSGETTGINFDTLERICRKVECGPSDLLVIEDSKPERKRKAKGE